jgi:hypothetical protein
MLDFCRSWVGRAEIARSVVLSLQCVARSRHLDQYSTETRSPHSLNAVLFAVRDVSSRIDCNMRIVNLQVILSVEQKRLRHNREVEALNQAHCLEVRMV